MLAVCLSRRPCVLARSLRGTASVIRYLSTSSSSDLSASAWPAIPNSTSPPDTLCLAIETSCDDTCVALLHQNAVGAANLLFNKKITSDNRGFRGVHPLNAVVSHTEHLGPLLREALNALPASPSNGKDAERTEETGHDAILIEGQVRRKPHLVAITRGPGMSSNLATGLNTAKGLALAWDVPLLAVNHMQAHALTPRLVSALNQYERSQPEQMPSLAAPGRADPDPRFPYLSLLVSGGHTLLVHSRSLTDHQILAEAMNIAIGDMIDKSARVILPVSEIADSESVMYGPMLERFAFPDVSGPADYEYEPPARRADEIRAFDSGLGWTLTPPLSGTTALAYDFAGFGSQVQRAVADRPDMPLPERRLLARHAMRLAFEHLASRLLLVLKAEPETYRHVETLVVAGGVASNKYLMHILQAMLAVRGFGHLRICAPPPALCTDNAAMIAWTGLEMWRSGFTSQLDVLPIRKWPIDPRAEGGGIEGASGWIRNPPKESRSLQNVRDS